MSHATLFSPFRRSLSESTSTLIHQPYHRMQYSTCSVGYQYRLPRVRQLIARSPGNLKSNLSCCDSITIKILEHHLCVTSSGASHTGNVTREGQFQLVLAMKSIIPILPRDVKQTVPSMCLSKSRVTMAGNLRNRGESLTRPW